MSPKQQNDEAPFNKEKAVSFLQLVASGKIREAYNRYAGPGFIHHNPFFAGMLNHL